MTAGLLLGGRQRWARLWGRLGRRGRAQTHTADLQVFFEAVGLEQVVEFEGADVAASGQDFALEISDDGAQFLQGVTSPQEFEPHPFAVKAQAQALPGQLELLLEVLREALARILYPIACRLVNNLVVWAWRPEDGFLNGHLWQQC